MEFTPNTAEDPLTTDGAITERQTLKQADIDRIADEYAEKCHWTKFKYGRFRIEFNPVVMIASSFVIWAVVGWCCLEPTKSLATLTPVMAWVTKTWTWLFIASRNIWLLFVIIIFFSKYGKLKLGRDDEEAEFSDISYFVMLLSTALAGGLFYFPIFEVLQHYTVVPNGNIFGASNTDDQRAQEALNVAIFHVGFHNWASFLIMGILLSCVGYWKGLPIAVRSCFYPLLGDRAFGWIGDLVDALGIICSMMGIASGLGICAVTLNAGLHRLYDNIPISTFSQVCIVWVITAIATASLLSGLKRGIKVLSQIGFALLSFILLTWTFYEDTWYLLNSLVQSIGFQIQTTIGLGSHTDSFGQMNNSPDGRSAPQWMKDWTVFYSAYFIAYTILGGMFIARISRGRTIRQLISYSMVLPSLYSVYWVAVAGSAGIKVEREAIAANITCDSELGGKYSNMSFNGLYRLSCRSATDVWFDVLESFPELYQFLSALSVVAMALFFITTSDSASLVIDSLSANGRPEAPRIQRVYWALTEGACATGLLVAGGEEAVEAFRAFCIASSLPYTVILNFLCIALWRILRSEVAGKDTVLPEFSHDLFRTFGSLKQTTKFLLAVLAPWYLIGKAHSKITKSRSLMPVIAIAVLFYSSATLVIFQVMGPGLAYIAASLYLGFVVTACRTRILVRKAFGIEGNVVLDFFALLILYPFAAVQMYDHVENAWICDAASDKAYNEGQSRRNRGQGRAFLHTTDVKDILNDNLEISRA